MGRDRIVQYEACGMDAVGVFPHCPVKEGIYRPGSTSFFLSLRAGWECTDRYLGMTDVRRRTIEGEGACMFLSLLREVDRCA